MKTDLSARVYAYLQRIPDGKVVTYGQIAADLGNPRLSRVIGTILHQNPDPDRIACFKVVNREGQLAENFAFGGIGAHKARLIASGVEVEGDRVDLRRYQWESD